MHFIYYTWNENSAEDLVSSLTAMEHTVTKIDLPIADYNHDEIFYQEFSKKVKKLNVDAIITFNYFPIISDIANSFDLPYISWVYDSPHYTLYSNNVRNSCNYIFIFDDSQYQTLKNENIPHIYHLPLPVNTARLNHSLGQNPWEKKSTHSVSFVGSLYEGNFFRKINYLPENLSGYIDGLIAAQKKIFGQDLIQPLITDDITEQLNKYIKFDMGKDYFIKNNLIYSDMICTELTHQERLEYLNVLAKKHSLSLYSASDKKLVPNADYMGYISYQDTMPIVFCESKININITLRSIMSGIPLRALDIMGAGGFLLSNYQAEFDLYFKEGIDLVMFDSMEDCLDKASFYLNHDEERKSIAENGWKKIQSEFSYQILLDKIIQTVFQ